MQNDNETTTHQLHDLLNTLDVLSPHTKLKTQKRAFLPINYQDMIRDNKAHLAIVKKTVHPPNKIICPFFLNAGHFSQFDITVMQNSLH